MKILRYDDHEKDIIQITRKEFREKGIDFICSNGLIESLRSRGAHEAVAIEQLKNTLLFSEFEDVLFGKESHEKTSTCNHGN